MDRRAVIDVLRAHENDLRKDGVVALSLFGSVARDEATDISDIDVAVKFSDDVLQSGFGYFGAISDLKEKLEALTSSPVDIVPEPVRRESLRIALERDQIVAF